MTTITVTVEGGLVQDVTGVPNGITVRIEDYDADEVGDGCAEKQTDGRLAWVSHYEGYEGPAPQFVSNDALPPVPSAEQRLTWRCLDCDAFWYDGKLEQRGDDSTCIHGDIQRLTECCGAPLDEVGFCPKCKEHA